MASKETYVYGSPIGEGVAWHENGKMSSRGAWKDSWKSGLWKYWDESGAMTSEVNRTGTEAKTTIYYPSGKKKAIGVFRRGSKLGKWVYWNEDGSEKAACDFGDGLFSLSNKPCEIIAEELDPKGFSLPIPTAIISPDGNVTVKIASQSYSLQHTVWMGGRYRSGEQGKLNRVFYPQGGVWQKSPKNMYERPVFKKGKNFEKIIEDEKNGFSENVAEYREEIVKQGKLKSGSKYIEPYFSRRHWLNAV